MDTCYDPQELWSSEKLRDSLSQKVRDEYYNQYKDLCSSKKSFFDGFKEKGLGHSKMMPLCQHHGTCPTCEKMCYSDFILIQDKLQLSKQIRCTDCEETCQGNWLYKSRDICNNSIITSDDALRLPQTWKCGGRSKGAKAYCGFCLAHWIKTFRSEESISQMIDRTVCHLTAAQLLYYHVVEMEITCDPVSLEDDGRSYAYVLDPLGEAFRSSSFSLDKDKNVVVHSTETNNCQTLVQQVVDACSVNLHTNRETFRTVTLQTLENQLDKRIEAMKDIASISGPLFILRLAKYALGQLPFNSMEELRETLQTGDALRSGSTSTSDISTMKKTIEELETENKELKKTVAEMENTFGDSSSDSGSDSDSSSDSGCDSGSDSECDSESETSKKRRRVDDEGIFDENDSYITNKKYIPV